MNVTQTPATMALGCGGSLTLLGSFVSGFYLGHSQATGQYIDSNLASILKYSPLIIGGTFGTIAGKVQLNVPENLEEIIKNTPPGIDRAQAEGCARGCAPIVGGIFSLALMGAVTYVGYAIGNAMGK